MYILQRMTFLLTQTDNLKNLLWYNMLCIYCKEWHFSWPKPTKVLFHWWKLMLLRALFILKNTSNVIHASNILLTHLIIKVHSALVVFFLNLIWQDFILRKHARKIDKHQCVIKGHIKFLIWIYLRGHNWRI